MSPELAAQTLEALGYSVRMDWHNFGKNIPFVGRVQLERMYAYRATASDRCGVYLYRISDRTFSSVHRLRPNKIIRVTKWVERANEIEIAEIRARHPDFDQMAEVATTISMCS